MPMSMSSDKFRCRRVRSRKEHICHSRSWEGTEDREHLRVHMLAVFPLALALERLTTLMMEQPPFQFQLLCLCFPSLVARTTTSSMITSFVS